MERDNDPAAVASSATTEIPASDEPIAVPCDPQGLPKRLGRYVPLQVIGAGGMGTVYTAFDTELARHVAIKVLAHGPGRRAGINAGPRLRREARALAKLTHPNVVAIYDVGQVGETVFVAMELVEGQTLRVWQQQKQRSWTELVDVYRQAGEGLAAAHRQGLVHRDFKPDNAIIDLRGRVRVLDFGLAVAESEPPAPTLDTPTDGASVVDRLTLTGAVLGTPAYMSPEQLHGRAASPRSDQFSFCVALFEALYGERPFAANTLDELRAAIGTGVVATPKTTHRIPPWLRRAVVRGLHPDPNKRFANMPSLLRVLARGRQGFRRGAAVLGVGATAVLLVSTMAPRAVATLDPCTVAAATIESDWGQPQREATRRALTRSGLPYGTDAWSRVEPGLDSYADAWAAKRRTVCEASRDASREGDDERIGHADDQLACLNGRRAAFSELVALLAEADADMTAKASSAVAQLPALRACDEAVHALAGRSPAIVGGLRAQLGRAHALQLAGRYPQSLEEAKAVVARAQELGDDALLAEALLRTGIAHEKMAAYPEAEAALSRAAMLAVEAKLDDIAARASVELTGVVGYQLVRFEDGVAWARHAQAAVARARSEPPVRARLWSNLGATYDRHGDLQRARDYYAKGLAQVGDADDDLSQQLVASTLNNLGNAQARLGELEQATMHLERAVAQLEALRGPAHPEVAITLLNLGSLQLDRGDLQRAQDHHRRALTIAEQALGADHPVVATALTNLGMTLQAAGLPAQARPVFERAVAVLEKVVGTEHHRTAVALNNLGEALRDLGDPEGALVLHRRTLSIWTAVHGTEHPVLAFAENNIGLALLADGDPEQAAQYLDRALSRRLAAKTESALIGCSRLGLARALDTHGVQPERARALGEAAAEDLRGAPGRYRREQEALARWHAR